MRAGRLRGLPALAHRMTADAWIGTAISFALLALLALSAWALDRYTNGRDR